MRRNKYRTGLEHEERIHEKRDRLEGLELLYATYEQRGLRPYMCPEMRFLKKRILSVRQQLKAMGEGIGPGEAGA